MEELLVKIVRYCCDQAERDDVEGDEQGRWDKLASAIMRARPEIDWGKLDMCERLSAEA